VILGADPFPFWDQVAVDIEAARLLTYNAARLKDEGKVRSLSFLCFVERSRSRVLTFLLHSPLRNSLSPPRLLWPSTSLPRSPSEPPVRPLSGVEESDSLERYVAFSLLSFSFFFYHRYHSGLGEDPLCRTVQSFRSVLRVWLTLFVWFERQTGIEKYWRDSMIGKIYEGTSNIQLSTIAKAVQKRLGGK